MAFVEAWMMHKLFFIWPTLVINNSHISIKMMVDEKGERILKILDKVLGNISKNKKHS